MAYLRKQGAYAATPMPGMVLSDINMPKKNGFEMLADIKADPRLRALPGRYADRQRSRGRNIHSDRLSRCLLRTLVNL